MNINTFEDFWFGEIGLNVENIAYTPVSVVFDFGGSVGIAVQGEGWDGHGEIHFSVFENVGVEDVEWIAVNGYVCGIKENEEDDGSFTVEFYGPDARLFGWGRSQCNCGENVDQIFG